MNYAKHLIFIIKNTNFALSNLAVYCGISIFHATESVEGCIMQVVGPLLPVQTDLLKSSKFIYLYYCPSKNGSLATYKESFMVPSNVTYSTFVDTNMVQVYAKEQYLHL